uniref:Secreted protein n=1 Tax=Anguilla anguilla TaxID=7936 RepID=A0A0E9PFL0_ANGAN
MAWYTSCCTSSWCSAWPMGCPTAVWGCSGPGRCWPTWLCTCQGSSSENTARTFAPPTG